MTAAGKVVGVALVVAVAVTGCGGRSSTAPVPTTPTESWSSTDCVRQSGAIADEALSFVHTYKPGFGVGSTSDVAYFGLRTVLGGFKQHHCATRVLGRTLARRLTRKQQRELLAHLPRGMAAYLRLTIAGH